MEVKCYGLLLFLVSVAVSYCQFQDNHVTSLKPRYQKCHESTLPANDFKLSKCWSLVDTIGVLYEIYPQPPPIPINITFSTPNSDRYTVKPTRATLSISDFTINFFDRRRPSSTKHTRKPADVATTATPSTLHYVPVTTTVNPAFNQFLHQMLDREVCKIFMPVALMITKGEMEKVCCDAYCYCQSLLSEDKNFCGETVRLNHFQEEPN